MMESRTDAEHLTDQMSAQPSDSTKHDPPKNDDCALHQQPPFGDHCRAGMSSIHSAGVSAVFMTEHAESASEAGTTQYANGGANPPSVKQESSVGDGMHQQVPAQKAEDGVQASAVNSTTVGVMQVSLSIGSSNGGM